MGSSIKLRTSSGSRTLTLSARQAHEMELLLNVLSDGDGRPYSYGHAHSNVGDMLYAQRSRSDVSEADMDILEMLYRRVAGGENWRNSMRIAAAAAARWYEAGNPPADASR